MSIDFSIVSQEPLIHPFCSLTLEGDCFRAIEPGAYLLTSQGAVFYLMQTGVSTAQIILHEDQCDAPLLLSAQLVKHVFPALQKNDFTIIISHSTMLAGCLFYVKHYLKNFNGIVFIESDGSFPFYPVPSRTLVTHLPPGVIAALPLLEDWGVPSRLTSTAPEPLPGCFSGTAQALLAHWWPLTTPPEYRVVCLR